MDFRKKSLIHGYVWALFGKYLFSFSLLNYKLNYKIYASTKFHNFFSIKWYVACEKRLKFEKVSKFKMLEL